MDKIFKILLIIWITYYAVKTGFQIEVLENPAVETLFAIISLVVIIEVISRVIKNRKGEEEKSD